MKLVLIMPYFPRSDFLKYKQTNIASQQLLLHSFLCISHSDIVMSQAPTIPTLPSGDVILRATPEALRISQAIDHAAKARSKSKTQVHTAAWTASMQKHKVPDELLIKSRYKLQFGRPLSGSWRMIWDMRRMSWMTCKRKEDIRQICC